MTEIRKLDNCKYISKEEKEKNKRKNKIKDGIIMETTEIIDKIKEKSKELEISRIELVKSEIINDVLWLQILLYDNEPLPIKLDLLQDIYNFPKAKIFASPGSGLNIESNFITPKYQNLALYIAKKGYMFIGITPREDSVPTDFNFEVMKDWGIEKHTIDLKKIVTLFQKIISTDFELLGHSIGAINVLNYSSKFGDKHLKAVRIIDVVGQFSPNSQEFINSQLSLNATNEFINNRGIFVNQEIAGLKYLAQQAQINPRDDSGIPRPMGGNFTNEAIIYFSLILTNQLPGPLTEITGLPSSWFFKGGYLTGTYEFGENPADDKYGLNHTKISTVYSAINSIGSGIYPLAYERDLYGLWRGSYHLIWNEIKVPIYYINAESGFGDASYTTGLLKTLDKFDVVKDYGHADPVFSETANIDFWNILIS